ncbi:hypothetical protein B0H14DRAFT_2639449 [Mycena olivaceomarginata]|nr:hypothetical protein B0H14DRAFT_2639449 [Mycena olivaceomarginata]
MSVHRRRPPSSPVSSPTRATDELLELTQQMTPSKPPDVLRRLRRDLQSHANNIRDDITTLKHHQAAYIRKGPAFVVQEALFLLDDVFGVDEDEDFDPEDEFTSDKNKVQGQLRRILEFLPADFVDGMSGQCSSTSHRLHGPGLTHIVDDVKPFTTSPGRRIAFRTLIGWQPGTETHEPYYSKLNVPILYDGWQGEKDLTRLFCGPCLLKIHATIIRGPKGAVGLFDGIPKRPAAKTIEKMYKIKFSTLGAIVNASILAIWLHSADTQLTEIGDETGINYRERHSYYMQHIVEALASKKAWALDLVAYWDHILFPDAYAPQSTSAGDQRLEDAEDDNDFFDSAPAVESPTRPVRPTNPASPNQDDSPSPSGPLRGNHRQQRSGSGGPRVPIASNSHSLHACHTSFLDVNALNNVEPDPVHLNTITSNMILFLILLLWFQGVYKYIEAILTPYGPWRLSTAKKPLPAVVDHLNFNPTKFLSLKLCSNRPNIIYATHRIVGSLSDFHNLNFLVGNPFTFVRKVVVFHDDTHQCTDAASYVDKLLPVHLQNSGLVRHYHGGMSKDYLTKAHPLRNRPLNSGQGGPEDPVRPISGRLIKDAKKPPAHWTGHDSICVIDALVISTEWCCDLNHPGHPSKKFDKRTFFPGRFIYSGDNGAIYAGDHNETDRVWLNPPKGKKRKAKGLPNRKVPDRGGLENCLQLWLETAHASDPLRSVRPPTFILPPKSIKALAAVHPTRIQSIAQVVSTIQETQEWEEEWGAQSFRHNLYLRPRANLGIRCSCAQCNRQAPKDPANTRRER